MGLFGASRSANRMGARQQYRTMARMQRRRSMVQTDTGMHQDFQQRDDGSDQEYSESQAASAEPDYTAELEKLAQLKNKGIITDEEYQVKKKQILGI